MKELLTVKANVDRIMGYEEKSRQRKTMPRSSLRDDDRLMDLGFREGKPAVAFPLVCSPAQDGNRVKSAKHRPLAACS